MELKIPKNMKNKSDNNKVGRGVKMRGSSGARFVLFLGDEGVILVYLKGNTVINRQFVSDASESNLQELLQTLSKDTHAPLLLVVDSMDQSFMQQTLPPVSKMSVAKLIRRRLERDFAGNDIKGAILLGREKVGRKDWNFLMVALEKSPQLTVWVDFIQSLPNRFLGIYLASVESEMLVEKLERAMGVPDSKEEVKWRFFVSHNKVGGFRQVIMKNGRIIFTRMAQPLAESNAEVIAGGIEQEMLSTIEYMKRLSFSPQHRLDVIIIASTGIKEVIDPSKFNATHFYTLTPYEVGQHLGIKGAAQPSDQFGDVIMAAVIGSSKKHVLKLTAPETRRIESAYQFMTMQRWLAAITICGALGYSAYTTYEIASLLGETSELSDQKIIMQQKLDSLREEVKKSKLDVEKASDFIDFYQQITEDRVSPLPLIKKFEGLAKAPVWVKNFDWEIVDVDKAPAGNDKRPVMKATVTLEFPEEAREARLFKVLSTRVLNDCKKLFEGFEVEYVTKQKGKSKDEKLQIRSGTAQEEKVESLEVKMTIKGSMSLLEKPAEEAPKVSDTPIIPVTPVPQQEVKP